MFILPKKSKNMDLFEDKRKPKNIQFCVWDTQGNVQQWHQDDIETKKVSADARKEGGNN